MIQDMFLICPKGPIHNHTHTRTHATEMLVIDCIIHGSHRCGTWHVTCIPARLLHVNKVCLRSSDVPDASSPSSRWGDCTPAGYGADGQQNPTSGGPGGCPGGWVSPRRAPTAVPWARHHARLRIVTDRCSAPDPTDSWSEPGSVLVRGSHSSHVTTKLYFLTVLTILATYWF